MRGVADHLLTERPDNPAAPSCLAPFKLRRGALSRGASFDADEVERRE
jgi:hypothetical protein